MEGVGIGISEDSAASLYFVNTLCMSPLEPKCTARRLVSLTESQRYFPNVSHSSSTFL